MKRVLILILLPWMIQAWIPDRTFAQISPGELSSAHAQLEGVGNCTQCHALGRAVPNDNCLACHTELRTRIQANTGFHAAVRDKPCVECHKEHHGRKFALMHFDTRSFDHRSTGFVLEGKHRQLECEKCHTKANVKARDVLLKMAEDTHTYLGLSRDCISCHTDAHRGQVSTQCQQCHSFDAWKPVTRFDHAKAKFRLTGKHIQVSCSKCHKNDIENGKVMRLVGLAFSTCAACHHDPHGGRFQNKCESCHTTGGWDQGVARNFDHSTTRFALRGRHAAVRCEQCHESRRSTMKAGDEFHIAKFQHCSDCHADTHAGEFAGKVGSGQCETCHTEQGFSPSSFSHATADFPLKGKHVSVPCGQCHTSYDKRSTARGPLTFHVVKFQRCASCHADAHSGQFARRADQGARNEGEPAS